MVMVSESGGSGESGAPLLRWPQPLAACEHGVPSLVQVVAALAVLDLEQARNEGRTWYLSPRRVAGWLGCTVSSLVGPPKVVSAWHRAKGPSWLLLERSCQWFVAGVRNAFPDGPGKRLEAWHALRPSLGSLGKLQDVLRRALGGELVVPMHAPTQEPRRTAKKRSSAPQAAPLLETSPELPTSPSSAAQVVPDVQPNEPIKGPVAAPKPKAKAKGRTKRKRSKKATPLPQTLPECFLALDVETTGRTEDDRVWEVAVVRFEAGKETWSNANRYNPRRELNYFASKLTGVRLSDLRGEPPIEEDLAEIHALLKGQVVVAHNLSFDRGMLRREFERVGLGWPETAGEICTVQVAKPHMKAAGKKSKLNICCEHFGIRLDNHHAAEDDARACGELLVKLLPRGLV